MAKVDIMTRNEFIKMQIGACEARIAAATAEADHHHDRMCSHSRKKLTQAFFLAATNATAIKNIALNELKYWRAQLDK